MNDFINFYNHLDFGMRLLVGIALMFIGGAWGVFAAYNEDVWWGRWTMMVPGMTLFFCASNPAKGIPPLIVQLSGMFLFFSTGLSLFSGTAIG
jgi:hypothetical protein